MTERWEYLTLLWGNGLRAIQSGEVSWWERYVICRRENEAGEERLAWDEKTKPEMQPTLVALLNELGDEGWELISEMPLVNTVQTGTHPGFDTVGSPISIRWLFKRRVAD
jgi:hypothetical protein